MGRAHQLSAVCLPGGPGNYAIMQLEGRRRGPLDARCTLNSIFGAQI